MCDFIDAMPQGEFLALVTFATWVLDKVLR